LNKIPPKRTAFSGNITLDAVSVTGLVITPSASPFPPAPPPTPPGPPTPPVPPAPTNSCCPKFNGCGSSKCKTTGFCVGSKASCEQHCAGVWCPGRGGIPSFAAAFSASPPPVSGSASPTGASAPCNGCGYACGGSCSSCGRCNTKPGCMSKDTCLTNCNSGHNAMWCGAVTPTPPTPPAPPTPPRPSNCPGGSLTACMSLCPADPPAVYKACVADCANRCAS